MRRFRKTKFLDFGVHIYSLFPTKVSILPFYFLFLSFNKTSAHKSKFSQSSPPPPPKKNLTELQVSQKFSKITVIVWNLGININSKEFALRAVVQDS